MVSPSIGGTQLGQYKLKGKQLLTYAALVGTRFILITFPGYIHPDEFFQSTEVAAADLLGLHTNKPWEFTHPTKPARSCITPHLTSGIALRLLPLVGIGSRTDTDIAAICHRRVAQLLGGYTIVIVLLPRLVLAGASLVLDLALLRAVRLLQRPPAHVLILASSWPVLVLQIRTFSNSMEALLLATALLLVLPPAPPRALAPTPRAIDSPAASSLASSAPPPRLPPSAAPGPAGSACPPPGSEQLPPGPPSLLCCAAFATVAATGVFVRFTFALFLLPPALYLLRRLLPPEPRAGASAAALRLAVLLAAFLAAAAALVAADSLYFAAPAGIAEAVRARAVVTPWNSLEYNMQADNLALHGLHPRYLHLLVNMPMLFGPLALLLLLSAAGLLRRALHSLRCSLPSAARPAAPPRETAAPLAPRVEALLWWMLAVPLGGLSLAPHQEARFLLPLVVPACALKAGPLLASRVLTSAWIAFNLGLVLVFGVAHQGGLLPALSSLHAALSPPARLTPLPHAPTHHLVFYRTYMPPESLLWAAPPRPWVQVEDLGGCSLDCLRDALDSKLPSADRRLPPCKPVILGGPVPRPLPGEIEEKECFHLPLVITPATGIPQAVIRDTALRAACPLPGTNDTETHGTWQLRLATSFGPHFSGEEMDSLIDVVKSGHDPRALWEALRLNVYQLVCDAQQLEDVDSKVGRHPQTSTDRFHNRQRLSPSASSDRGEL